MLEIGMLVVLAVMGVYFVKSTDLPKDLKNRSAQMRSEHNHNNSHSSANMTRKFALPKEFVKAQEFSHVEAQKIAAAKEEMHDLNLKIEAVKNEMHMLNSRNQELQKTLNAYSTKLQNLKNHVA